MLHKFQTEFKDFIVDEKVGGVLVNLIANSNLTVNDRLGIYRNNVIQNLTSALKIAYPNFTILVGDEFFEFVAYEYIKQNLPSSGVLLNYGDNFSDFLSGVKQLEAFPYAADFAEFEWLQHQCHHAIEDSSLTLPDLAKSLKNDENYVPQFKSCVKLFHSIHPIEQLWNMCVNQKEEELIQKENYLLLSKHNQVVEIINLSSLEFKFLKEFPNAEGISDNEAAEIITKFVNLGIFKK
jgi:hypothetical protein